MKESSSRTSSRRWEHWWDVILTNDKRGTHHYLPNRNPKGFTALTFYEDGLFECRIAQLNYRAFEGTIVLKSYRDSFIDKFESKSLFERLCQQAEARDMIVCGEGLCFKKLISVKGCHCKSRVYEDDKNTADARKSHAMLFDVCALKLFASSLPIQLMTERCS